MKKERVVTPEAFDSLLGWLDIDRDVAGKKYEAIRTRLIKIFACRGCGEAEDLADEAIDRVIGRVADIQATYSGDPALYFYGVAQKVHLEYIRKSRPPQPPPEVLPADDVEEEYACLDQCMEELEEEKRWIVIEYYRDERAAKINHRREIAEQLGIDVNVLRLRVHRIRVQLLPCIQECLERSPAH